MNILSVTAHNILPYPMPGKGQVMIVFNNFHYLIKLAEGQTPKGVASDFFASIRSRKPLQLVGHKNYWNIINATK